MNTLLYLHTEPEEWSLYPQTGKGLVKEDPQICLRIFD